MKKLFYNNTLRLIILLIISTAAGLFFWSYINAVRGIRVGEIWYSFVSVASLTLIILFRRRVSLKDVLVGLLFGLMCVPNAIPKYPSATTVYILGIYFDKSYIPHIASVVPAYIASMAIFKNSENKIYLFKNEKKHVLLKTVLCIVLGVGILSVLDCLRCISAGMPTVFNFNTIAIAIGLETGFFEEVVFRTFLFALCVLYTRGAKLTRLQSVLCYAVMIIPHTLAHFQFPYMLHIPLTVLSMAVKMLPMAVAQRKLNLASAVGIHTLHNIIVFTVLGVVQTI